MGHGRARRGDDHGDELVSNMDAFAKRERLRQIREGLDRSRADFERSMAEREAYPCLSDLPEIPQADDVAPLEYRTTAMPVEAIERRSEPAATVDVGSEYWNEMNQWLQSHLKRERKLTRAAVGEAIGQLLAEHEQRARSELQDEIRSLRIEVTALDETIRELRSIINAQGARVVDLPSRRLS
jgi:hypothetical protein